MKCSLCGVEIIKDNFTKKQWRGKIKRQQQTGKIYCSRNCSLKASGNYLTARNKTIRRQEMILNNPVKDPLVRKKISKTLKEMKHKPKKQGGNGRGLTVPQETLLNVLKKHHVHCIPEYVVLTKMKRGTGYPTCYKIDLAIADKMIGIEIDGSSHTSLIRQEQDCKKQIFLEQLGWKVLRYKNEEILTRLDSVVTEILSIISE